MVDIQPLVEALQSIVEGQKSAGFNKHIKMPGTFKPESRSEELGKWQDWRFAFENFIRILDDGMLTEMTVATESEKEMQMVSIALDQQKRAEKLYSLLSMLMRNRPQRLVRGVQDQNGYEAWRVLVRDMQPPTRQSGLALIQSLNKIKFDQGKSVAEQLPQFELLVREYEKTSGNTYPDDLKVAAVVSALPSTMRMHIQMHITEKTTYEDVKRRIELVEQVSTVWTADNNMQMPVKAHFDDDSGVAPMEVDAVWAKGSGKYGKDSKGGKKGFKGKDKGKKGEKGKFSSFGNKGKDGKGKKGKMDHSGKGKGVQCFNCGKYGHRAKECWSPKKVNKIEEQMEHGTSSSTSTSPSTSSSGGSLTSAAGLNKAQAVRMVRIEEDEECSGSPEYSVFDVTEFEESDQEGFERVRMVAEKEETVFHECFDVGDETLTSSIPLQVPWVSMDIQDEEDEVRSQSEIEHRVCMVKKDDGARLVAMTLDSGADISVAPVHYGEVGEPGLHRHVRMVDAQGQDIATTGHRKLRLSAETRDGQSVQFVENFALGNVSHPLMCMGKLLRQGWTLQRDGCGMFLRHEASGVDVPARLERNSLVMDVKVCAVMVGTEDEEREEEKEDEEDEIEGGEDAPFAAGAAGDGRVAVELEVAEDDPL